MTPDLIELAERVEAATGPDRELDGSIWWAMLAPDWVEHYDSTGYVRECIARDGSAGKALAQFADSADPYCLANIAFQKAYTSSLDAAMWLADERDVSELLCDAMDALGQAGWQEGTYKQRLAQFFTAACLRAHAAMLQEEVGRG